MFMNTGLLVYSLYLIFTFTQTLVGTSEVYKVDCSSLRMGQYLCPDPAYMDFIDPVTQQPKDCTKENKAKGIY